MRVVFIGTVDFSRSCLQTMLDAKANVVGVFTQSRAQARINSDWSDLLPLAKEYEVPVFYFEKILDPSTLKDIRALKPDIIFVLGLSQLLTTEFLQIPPMGVIGSHPALLPKNRGRHPLIWALVKGLKKSGLTFFYIDEGVDSGDIIMQWNFEIEITDTAADLYEKIKRIGAKMLRELIPLLGEKKASCVPQDHTKATYLRRRTKEDGLICWKEGAMRVYNLVRALTYPYVGAHTIFKGEEVKVWSALPPVSSEISSSTNYQPGEIMEVEDGQVTVWAKDGPLTISRLELDTNLLRPGEVFFDA